MPDTAQSLHFGERMDRVAVSGFHKKLAFLIGAGMFFDGFDLWLASSVLGALKSTGFSDIHMNGRFITATFAGMTIGAAAAGLIGDRFGRRMTYQLNLLIFGLASVAAALAPDMPFLIGARFVMGIGLGAEIVVGYATFAEFLPPSVRGKWLGILAIPVQAAIFAGALAGLIVIPLLGWRFMFWIAAVGAIIVWFLRKNIPESPRWLAQQGRLAEAEAIVERIELSSGLQPGLHQHVPQFAGPLAPPTSFRNPEIMLRLFVGSITAAATNCVAFGLLSFIPTFYINAGVSMVKSLSFSTIIAFGAPVGGVVALLIVDRIGRKKSLIYSAIFTAVVGCLYGYAGNGFALSLVGFVMVTGIYLNGVACYSMFLPEMFPTDIRLRGVSVCHVFGRVSSAIIPFAVVALYTNYGIVSVMAMVVGFLLVQALVVGLWGVETKQRSLESFAPSTQQSTALILES